MALHRTTSILTLTGCSRQATVCVMIEISKTATFANWIDDLRDTRGRARILARIERLAAGDAGDVTPVGEGVSELRIDYGPGLSRLASNETGLPAKRDCFRRHKSGQCQ